MLSIPIVFGVQGDGEVRAALDDLEKGIQSARTELIKLNNQRVLVDYKFSVNGKEIRQEFRGIAAETKKMNMEKKKAFGGEAGSIARQKKYIQQLKREREELKANTRAHSKRSAAIKQAQATLREMQGIEEGSVNRLKELRAGLIAQRNAVEINSPAFRKLTKRIQVFDRQLAKSRKTSINFTKVLGKFAVASAGIQAVAGALRAVGNAVDVYQRRAKEVEGFNLALTNLGIAQGEANRIFEQAESTASALGAPLQQVEKSYKRMLPALQAVGTSAEDSDRFIASISARTQVLGLNTEQSGRLLEAFAQVLSKGKLQAEELNQQISELDGAFRVQFAQALGVTTEALTELISSSQITADIFVATINKMENGVEILNKRIKNGTATFQQFQNLISIIETKNIEKIGQAILPALKSFQKIRLAVAEFIREFTKTTGFDFLVTVFNGVALGAEHVVTGLLNTVLAIETLISPITKLANLILSLGEGQTTLVSILVIVAAAIAGAVAVTKLWVALSRPLRVLRASYYLLGKSIRDSGTAAKVSGPAVSRYGQTVSIAGNQASAAAVKFGALLKTLGKVAVAFAAFNFIESIIGNFNAGAEAAKELNDTLGTAEFAMVEALENTGSQSVNLSEELGKATTSIEEASAASKEAAGTSQQLAGVILGVGAAAAVAATVLTGGFALPLLAAGTALYFSAQELNKSKELLEDSEFGRNLLKNIEQFNENLDKADEKIQEFGGKVGQVDFSNFEGASDDLVDLSKQYQLNADAAKERIAVLQELIKTEAKKTNLSKREKAISEGLIKISVNEIKTLQEKEAGYRRSAAAASSQIVALIKQGNVAAGTAASLRDLVRATKELEASIEAEKIEASVRALNKFGKSASDASRLAAAQIGIDAAASEERKKVYEEELGLLKKRERERGSLDDKERTRQADLTKLIAKETSTQAKLGIDARNAVIDAFEEGIRSAEQKVDMLANSVSTLKSSFDGVTSSLTSGLSAATGLIDEIVGREIKGLEVGSAQRRAIIQAQLIAQARANEVENKIAQLRLRVQNKIAVSQARIDQLRFQAEAKIAQARGQTDLAAAFNEAAKLQNVVIKGLQQQFRVEKTVLDVQKKTKDQKLLTKGLDEQLASSAGGVANQIGVQEQNLGSALDTLNSIVVQSEKYGTNMAKVVEKTQESAEKLQMTALTEGAQNATQVFRALDNAQGAAEGLSTVMAVAEGSFENIEGTGSRIVGYLKDATSEANKLSGIVAGGGNARALGGPVTGGQQYTVNDGGGREGFLSNAGKFSMLPAARNMQWTAPTSGTVIPANMVGDFLSAQSSNRINKASGGASPRVMNSGFESGNLIKQMTSAMSAAGSNQRITNNVTIQSEKPVQDASKIMANVARMRLRNSRRI